MNSKIVWIVALVLLLLTNPGTAATPEEVVQTLSSLSGAQRKSFLEEGARKEGQIVWYTSVSQSDNPKIVAAFEKRYPFVKMDLYRSSPSGVYTRLDTEARAGRFAADVVGTAAVQMWQLKQRKLSTPYRSPERRAFPNGAYDPEGYWSAFEVTPLVLAYNTNQVEAAAVPKSYEELLQPKWKGKMSLGTEDYEWFDVMLDTMGENKGLNYMRALAKQNLQMPGSSSRMRVQLMIAGESAMAIAARGRRITEFKDKGAPIDFAILEPYAGDPNFLALMRQSSHPHAAILFVDWMLSEDGQKTLAQIPRISIRKGIKQKGRIQELFEKEFVFVRPSSMGDNLNQLIDQYNKIFELNRAK